MDYFMPKNFVLEDRPSIEEYVKENMHAIANFSKTNNQDIKSFIDSLGETVLKKMIQKYDGCKSGNKLNLLKRQRKRSGKSKQEMSKFFYLNTKVIELNDDNCSMLSNRKSSMFDETNSLSACVLSSPNMSPTRFNDNNIIPDIFVKNPPEVYQYDHFYELGAFKHDEGTNSKTVNNIYEV
jgi:hypothetical protein